MKLKKKLLGLLVLLMLGNVLEAQSAPPTASVQLAWIASPSTNVVGYKIYYSTSTGVYTATRAFGNVLTCRIEGLAMGTTYYFAATAVDALGVESAFSNETSYAVPSLPAPPLPPGTLSIVK
jgi:Fibronectin type III domain